MAVFPNTNPLPTAQSEFSIQNGDSQQGRRHGRLDVGRHIVRPLIVVGEKRIALFHQPVEPVLQIAAG